MLTSMEKYLKEEEDEGYPTLGWNLTQDCNINKVNHYQPKPQ